MKQSLRDLDRWAMSPQAVRPLAGAAVAFGVLVMLVVVLLTELSPWLLLMPAIGFMLTVAMAYRRSRRSA